MHRKRGGEANYFNLLSDDEVLHIMNKLPDHPKTLLRLSVVCNRFSSLVSKIDSLTITRVNMSASPRSKLGNIAFEFFRILLGPSVAIHGFPIKTVIKKFKEIKHLRVETDFPKHDIATCSGSLLDVIMYLDAQSVKESDSFSSDVEFVNQTRDLFRPEVIDYFTGDLKLTLSLLVRDLIQDLHNLRSLILFKSSNVMFVLGEEQLATLRKISNNLKDNTTNAANV